MSGNIVDLTLRFARLIDTTDEVWQDRAVCAQTDPAAFFPEVGGPTGPAKQVCAGCEVRAECLAAATAADPRYGVYGKWGVWGGLSERERRGMRGGAVA